jgi:putative SOS response-associated peptidase YedK
MCGRFTIVLNGNDLEKEFNVEAPPDFTYESYNIAPSQTVPIVHLGGNQKRQLSLMDWGFLPSWAKDHKETLRPINARLETADNPKKSS